MSDLLARIEARAVALLRAKSMLDLHPEILDRVHVSALRSEEAGQFSPYSYLHALHDYESYVWVAKAVKVIAENICWLPVGVMRGEEKINHPLDDLLNQVNGHMSSADLWRQWATDLLLGGESGFELIKGGSRYAEIWPRQPNTIFIIPNAARLRYLEVQAYKIDDRLGAPYELPPEEFIHFKLYNPRNPWRGISPITAIRTSIAIDQFAQAWSKLFFQKSARPDYAVIAPAGLTKDERTEIEKMLTAKFGGIENAFQPVILEQGVTDVKPLDFRPRDLEWVEQREMSREEIGAIFGVPDEIMGWGRDTYENFATAHQVLWTLTLVPLVRFRDVALTEFFRNVGALTAQERIETDLTGISALQADFGALTLQAQALFGMGVPVSIINQRLGLGLPEYEGQDVGYLPLGLVPVSRAQATKNIALRAPRRKALEFGSAEHRAAWEIFIKRADKHEKKLGSVVAALFHRQQAEVLANLRRSGKSNGKSPRSAADDPFDLDAWLEEFREQVRPVLRSVVQESGDAALSDLNLGIAFDLTEPAVARFLKQREQRFAQEVNETTWEQLKESLREGIAAGESIPDLAARVESVMAERIRSSSETIARTEVIGASNGGTLEAWRQSEVVESKVWLAALDDRTRDSHREAHGQTVALEDDFEVGGGSGPAPGQIGIAEEDINCFPGNVLVYAEGLKAGISRLYHGEMVTLDFGQCGAGLTVTPNHPILTGRGWLAAGQIEKFDDLVGYALFEETVRSGPNPQYKPTRLDEIFRFLNMAGHSQRIVGAHPQFHGDGRQGQVNIIRPDRELWGEISTAFEQPATYQILALTDILLGNLSGQSSQFEFADRAPLASNGIMSRARNVFPFLNAHLSHAREHGCASITGLNAILQKSQSNDRSGNAEESGQKLFRFPGSVTLNQVVNIKRDSFHGLVYNLETEMGYYLANGIISHNCRCTMTAVIGEKRAHPERLSDESKIPAAHRLGVGLRPGRVPAH